MKTSELTGPALDWAVAIALGANTVKTPESQSWMLHWPSPLFGNQPRWSINAPGYSTDWAQGGPIIERERIRLDCAWGDQWDASHPASMHVAKKDGYTGWLHGPTPLIAAMRCYVASKLDDEVDVPKELTCPTK